MSLAVMIEAKFRRVFVGDGGGGEQMVSSLSDAEAMGRTQALIPY